MSRRNIKSFVLKYFFLNYFFVVRHISCILATCGPKYGLSLSWSLLKWPKVHTHMKGLLVFPQYQRSSKHGHDVRQNEYTFSNMGQEPWLKFCCNSNSESSEFLEVTEGNAYKHPLDSDTSKNITPDHHILNYVGSNIRFSHSF